MLTVAGPEGDKPPVVAGRRRILWHVLAAFAVTMLVVGQAGAFAEAVVWSTFTTLHLSRELFWIAASVVGIVVLFFAVKMFVHMMRVETRLDRNERIDNVPWTIFK
jgi:hypothetical protein